MTSLKIKHGLVFFAGGSFGNDVVVVVFEGVVGGGDRLQEIRCRFQIKNRLLLAIACRHHLLISEIGGLLLRLLAIGDVEWILGEIVLILVYADLRYLLLLGPWCRWLLHAPSRFTPGNCA